MVCWRHFRLLILTTLIVMTCGVACGDDDDGGGGGGGANGGGPDGGAGGGGPPGGGPGVLPSGDSFPWPVFDGTIPDTPEAANGAKTWYVDANNGNDSAEGNTFATAKKTFNAMWKSGKPKAGDTILLGGGIYREYPEWSNGPSGKADAPITIGSYGRGTGAPILDGGVKATTWTKYNAQGQTTVWQASLAGTKITSDKTPVLGVYVNSGKGEYALRELLHGQLHAYPNDSLPPNGTQANVGDNSNNYFYDKASNTVYADFGGTLGAAGDPNTADISLIYDSENSGGGHQLLVYLGPGHDYFHFIGMTIRAGSWSGVYTESNGHLFDHCDIKFNGGAAILFSFSGKALGNGNVVKQSRIWMNVLQNWPRFNNGYTAGGWPAAIAWSSQMNGLSEGNISYMNGGEGMTVGNTDLSGQSSTNNVVRHNIVFDNFSVNLYVNNVENVLLEENFVFQHPRDESQTFANLFQVSKGYSEDYGRRITPPNIVLGDEPGSAFDQQAHMANITVINNVAVGGKFAFLDYDDGTQGANRHGLRNCVIANNTFVLADKAIPGLNGYGWNHLVDTDQSATSFIQNNIFVSSIPEDQFAHLNGKGIGPGIDNDFNLYAGPAKWSIAGDLVDFAGWKSKNPTWDQHSFQADAALEDLTEFNKTAIEKPIYDWTKAKLKAGAPAIGKGTTVSKVVNDFTGKKRASATDLGALAP